MIIIVILQEVYDSLKEILNLLDGNVDLTDGDNHTPNNLSSFKYKSSFVINRNGVKIVVPLKYLSKFWRSSEMSVINCKVELSLSRIQIMCCPI